MQNRVACALLILFILLSAAGFADNKATYENDYVPANTKEHTGGCTSPDGNYIAEIVVGEGEAGQLTLYRKPLGTKHLRQSDRVLPIFEDVEGFIWLPKRPHTLIVATNCIYGQGSLVLWSGQHKKEPLRRVVHPDGEGFQLNGASLNGQAIFYRHFYGENYGRQLQMTLPH